MRKINSLREIMLRCFVVLIAMCSLTVVDADVFPEPFGLMWGMSKEDLKKLGFTKIEELGFTGYEVGYGFEIGYGFNVFASKLPPEPWSKGDNYYAITYKNQLVKVTAVSTVITDDIDGNEIKEMYSEIKELLTKKYGTPSSFEMDWCDEVDEFYTTVGCGSYFSNFMFSGVRIGITIIPIRPGTGHLLIEYSSPEFDSARRQSEKKTKEADAEAL